MEVQLYGDIFLLVNGGMDFFILWLAGIIAKRKMVLWRHILASIVMAVCPLAGVMFPQCSILYSPIGTLMILAIGILLAFSPKRLKEFANLLAVTYMASFTVGGCGMALFYALGAPPMFGGEIVYRSRLFPLKLLVILTAFFYTAVKIGAGFLESKIVNRKDYCTATVSHSGKDVSLSAFIDSGNGLKDPFSGYPVLIATFGSLQPFFTRQSREYFFGGDFSQSALQEYLLGAETSLALRLIPYTSLGQNNGLLLIFRPQRVILNHLGKQWMPKDVMVGIYIGTFNDGYDALVSPGLLESANEIISEGRTLYHE